MRITLEPGPAGTYVVRAENEASLLVQLDWDFPGLASAFGWVSCFCCATDGTIDCVHRTASEMLCEARAFLDRCLGESAADPGYFAGQ